MALDPPTNVEGAIVRLETVGAVIRSDPVTLFCPIVAPMSAVAFVAIKEVVTVNVAVLAPAATVTVPGTTELAASVLMVADMPPEGAVPESVRVPVEGAPPSTEFGLIATSIGIGGLTVRMNVFVPPPPAAVNVAVILVAVAKAVTANVALVLVDATVTDAGTVTLGALSDESVTTKPAVGAAVLIVTVPVVVPPP